MTSEESIYGPEIATNEFIINQLKAEIEQLKAQWTKTNAEYERVSKALCRVQQENERLMARLELDYGFDQDGNTIPLTAELAKSYPDGIDCRDATIRLMFDRIKALRAQLAACTLNKDIDEPA